MDTNQFLLHTYLKHDIHWCSSKTAFFFCWWWI